MWLRAITVVLPKFLSSAVLASGSVKLSPLGDFCLISVRTVHGSSGPGIPSAMKADCETLLPNESSSRGHHTCVYGRWGPRGRAL